MKELLSLLTWQMPAAQELSYYLSTPYPLTMSPLLNKLISKQENALLKIGFMADQ